MAFTFFAEDGADPAGIQVDIDVAYGGVFTQVDAIIHRDSVVKGAGHVMFFVNLEPGPVTVTYTLADGISCYQHPAWSGVMQNNILTYPGTLSGISFGCRPSN